MRKSRQRSETQMMFSERYGYKKIDESFLWENINPHLKTRIWNVFYINLFEEMNTIPQQIYLSSKFVQHLVDAFFKKDVSFLSEKSPSQSIDEIQKLFYELCWYEIYDFIEFFAKNYKERKEKDSIIQEINKVLKEEKAPYRVIDGIVTPLTSEEEIREIEKALNISDKFKNPKEHFRKALSLMSDRKNPDYANSIKESICALESVVQILLGEKGTLGELIKNLKVHTALKQGFRNLYGWASDEGGIRHAKTGESLEPGIDEARYMLVISSAFINYLIAKVDDYEPNGSSAKI